MSVEQITFSGYQAGKGKVQHMQGISDGDLWEYETAVRDVAGDDVAGLTWEPLTNGAVRVAGGTPSGVLRMDSVRFRIGGVWYDRPPIEFSSVELPEIDELHVPVKTVLFTAEDGTEIYDYQ